MTDEPTISARIVIADDDPQLRRLLADGLGRDGHDVELATTGFELLARLDRPATRKVDLVISDVRMPGLGGLDVLAGLRSAHRPEHWDTPVILITAFGDEETYAKADLLDAAVFDKPFDVDALRRFVQVVLVRAGEVPA